MTQRPYNPEKPLTSALRALQDYLAAAFDPEVVEVQSGYPNVAIITREMPLSKTLVHIDLDDSTPYAVGFGRPGDSIYDSGTLSVQPRVADAYYELMFDMGVWASEESGGGTHRMEVHETLNHLLVGSVADDELATATNMLHLVLPGMRGGRYILDTYNDVPLWRIADLMLPIKIFSRRLPTPEPSIETLGIEIEIEVSVDI